MVLLTFLQSAVKLAIEGPRAVTVATDEQPCRGLLSGGRRRCGLSEDSSAFDLYQYQEEADCDKASSNQGVGLVWNRVGV